MIILDLNQVMLSNLMVQIGNHTNMELEEGMVRHMVLNTIRSIRTKFRDEYGEMVIACDNRNYWRKQVFPYYKANRKKNIDKSELDWKAIFDCMTKIRGELKEYFPYRVIDVDHAEADDIIATLVKKFALPADDFSFMNVGQNQILIVSGDKDFIQLHKYEGVRQYDPVRKRWIQHPNPERYLEEHVLKGDSGDGVPNVLSPDNVFVIGDRQKPLTQKKLDAFIELTLDGKFDHPVYRNYMRNKQLIDLSFVPEEVSTEVLRQYDDQANKGRGKLFNYFIQNKLKHLMESINDF